MDSDRGESLSMWRTFLVAAMCGLTGTVHAQNADLNFDIPIAELRRSLPENTPVVVKRWRMNQWPQNSDPFFRHETMEVALGYKIRAQIKDRDKEGKFGSGFFADGDTIVVQGGWRIHKAVKAHNDFFDGVFTIRLKIVPTRDGVVPRVVNANFHWNKSAAGSIVNILGFGVVDFLSEMLALEIQGTANRAIRRELQKAEAKYPQLRQLRSATSVKIYSNVIRVTVPSAALVR